MHPGRIFRTISVRLAAVVALVCAPSAARAAKEVSVENLRVGFANTQQNNLFKVGSWTPVWVQLMGGDERFSGVLVVEVPDDNGTPTYFRQPIDVGPRESVRVVTYARPGSRDPNFLLQFLDRNGRRHGPVFDGAMMLQAGATAGGQQALFPLQADETLLISLGNAQGVDQVPGLPAFKSERNVSGNELTVARIDSTSGGQLPGRWYGFDAAGAIVVDTNDRDLMQNLAVRGQALVDWVARGGHLVVAVGGNWQSARDSVLGPLLPAVPNGQRQVASLESLDSYAGASKPITPAGSAKVVVTKLEEVDSKGGKVLAATGNLPLVVRGPYGFGRVTLVAFDADQKPFADWPDRALFWVKTLDLRSRGNSGDAATTVRVGGGGRALYQTGVSDLATQLRQALEQFPGVKLVPFGWVAFFIFVYILLIGPGDYFLLKKVFKRMELTWITFPTIVLTVSLLAYFAAYLVKGKELRVNKVDVVDVDQVSGLARGHSFFNLFSPQNRDYDVTVVPLPLDRPAPPSSADAAPRAPAGTEVLTTWLGVPEAGFGGMGNSGRLGLAGRGYTSAPDGSSEMLEGVRVPIWSTKFLTARWLGPTTPLFESDILPVGTDRLAGTVTSKLDLPLEDAILAFNKHVYILGDVAPGATVRVELSQDRQLSGLLRSNSPKYEPGNVGGGKISRADLMKAVMFHGSQGTSTSERAMANSVLHTLDLSGQLALDRPMLVGVVKRPAAQLVLANAPSPPRIDQTTIVRVILPLAKPLENKGK